MPHVSAGEARDILEELKASLVLLPDDPTTAQQGRIRDEIIRANHSLSEFDFIANSQEFTQGQLLLAREIRSGAQEEARYLDQIRAIAFGGDAQEAAIRMAQYIKSSNCFNFTHQADKSWKDLPKSVQDGAEQILGAYLNGVAKTGILEACVLAIRTERVGTVLNYFLSNQLEADLRRHNNLDPRPDLAQYLRDRIQKSDMSAYVSMTQKNVKGKSEATSTLHVNDLAERDPNATRQGNRIDHFTLVEDPDGSKRVVFGNSFSGGEPGKQVRSFVKYYLAIEQSTRTELCADGTPNPLYGAKLEPFYLHAGLFSSIDEDAPSGTGMGVANLLKGAIKEGTMSSEHARALGMLSLLGVAAHCESPRDESIFFRHNMFVCGSDTHHAFLFMQDLETDGDELTSPRRMAKIMGFMAEEMKKAVDALAVVVGQPSTATFSRDMLAIVDRFLDRSQIVFPSMLDQSTWNEAMVPLLNATSSLRNRVLESGGVMEVEREMMENIKSRSQRMIRDGMDNTQLYGRTLKSFAEPTMQVEILFSSHAKLEKEQKKQQKEVGEFESRASFLLPRLSYQLIARRENQDLPMLNRDERQALTEAKGVFQEEVGHNSSPIIAACLQLCQLHAATRRGGNPEPTRTIEEQAREVFEKNGLNPSHYGASATRKVIAKRSMIKKMRR